MADLVALPIAGRPLTVIAAADAFLGSLNNPNTVRNYGIGIDKTAERVGDDRALRRRCASIAGPITQASLTWPSGLET